LLRAERQKTTSKLAEIINNAILSGKIVPSDITVQLLQNAMEEEKEKNKFVIDGFPRSIENKNAWDTLLGSTCTVEFVLYLDCPESVMTQRLVSIVCLLLFSFCTPPQMTLNKLVLKNLFFYSYNVDKHLAEQMIIWKL